ncbi:hypothetical protein [Mesorhizobium comanense]|uniref:hypothetical protein n=1 Tax=Mesorhizobium comanense TaxID=2502215 RepID=UPI0010F6E290|nr:hypothetical protein [Mesorhizobium comanense]
MSVGTMAFAAILGFTSPAAVADAPAALHPLDVSILFPAPKDAADLANFISVADLADAGGAPLVPDPLFQEFLAIAASDAGQVAVPGGTPAQIGLPDAVKDIRNWFVAGIRVDVGAPGLSKNVMAAFGQIPQVRLILQPVTVQGGAVKIHDRAAHMIFSFAKGKAQSQETCAIPMLSRIDPDLDHFRTALADFASLRDDLAKGSLGAASISTEGPLDVHPALRDAKARKPFRDRLVAVLGKDLSARQLGAMAAMGLPKSAPEPWIFIAMQRQPGTGKLVAVPSPALDGKATAELVRFFGDKVLPAPVSDNLNETMTTCFRLPGDRRGVSTATLLNGTASEQDTIALTATIADPSKSHFFNTDCVSCHTETRLLRSRSPTTSIEGVAEAVLPKDRWNVRNFGWGLEPGGLRPTITRRTATETDEVVKAANELLQEVQ